MKNIKFEKIEQVKNEVQDKINKASQYVLKSFEEDFDIRFTHESTKIEGNTLSIHEVKTLLIDNISVGGKDLREIYEVVNNRKAFEYVKKSVKQKRSLEEELIKDIHQLVMENIIDGGIYRNLNVQITGSNFVPTEWINVRNEMKYFIQDYKLNELHMNPIELASWVHAKFVKIHPFIDGNGRVARLLLNFVLMSNNYLPIIIESKEAHDYYKTLDNFTKKENINDFYNFILNKELEILEFYNKYI
ncbi:Fic family protein [Anaerococcus sp. AGMB09787]|uniref:Fic family protein n=1 Tax=Anaerococcus sp. AGMB09787 TaxID=2922869 RepID=UPI001FAFA483|nr:Fic family protein [Anaerococcus sp. AGMB09787]